MRGESMSELFFTPGAVGGVSTATPRVDHPAARALEAARAKAAMDASTLLTSYHDKIAEIRDDDALEDGPNNDYLSTEAKAYIIQDRKRAAAEELCTRARSLSTRRSLTPWQGRVRSIPPSCARLSSVWAMMVRLCSPKP
jgi:hypothetical protein